MRINPDKERILLAHVYEKGTPKTEIEERRLEMRELIRSSTGVLAVEIDAPVESKNAKYYIGKGKVEQLRTEADRTKAVTFVFSVDLSPSQTRNLEQEFERTVIDRTGLILDIFARRARTREGKLQVELAQNMYLLPRLDGRGVFLSRLGGGVGTRGPGEQKLEVDRRKIRQRISRLKQELEDLRGHRSRIRQHRDREQFIRAVLIGYTNAGKSTLLNTLTKSEVWTKDLMFATLDPTTRNLHLANGHQVLLTDTVGMLSNLPHDLIEAFQATLEEIQEADLIVHVVDGSHAAFAQHMHTVELELERMGLKHRRQILVFNKIDLLPEAAQKGLMSNYPDAVLVSAVNRDGLDRLREKIRTTLQQ